MLETGYNSRFETRMERMFCAVSSVTRIVYLSDLHFTKRSGEMADKLVKELNRLKPDLILLGGDYADTHAGLMHLEALLKGISTISPTLAVAGNHDRFFGMDEFRTIMENNQVRWIEGESADLVIKGIQIRIDGNKAVERAGNHAVRILCLHKPVDPEKLMVNYHLAFAGHLHGSQCVFWENEKGLFPGRFFYKWNRLKAVVGDCHYFISKGLGDTLRIRYNCSKELVVVDLETKACD